MTKYNIVRIKHLLPMLEENRYPNHPRFLAEMKKLDPAAAAIERHASEYRDDMFPEMLHRFKEAIEKAK